MRNLAINSLLALAGDVVISAALETAAWWLAVRRPAVLVPSPANCLQRDRLLSLSLRPNCVGVLSETKFRTNSRGHRSPELRPGRARILSTGDSCTWGWRVAQEESYPMVLQQLLDDGAGKTRYDVINAGHTSYQGLLYLRERGLAFDPQIVIVNSNFPRDDSNFPRDVVASLTTRT